MIGKRERKEPLVQPKLLGKRLGLAIEERGVSQQQLAELAGVSQSEISRIVNGKQSYVSLDVVLRMARALRVRLNWVFYGTGEMHESDDDDEEETTGMRRSAKPPGLQLVNPGSKADDM